LKVVPQTTGGLDPKIIQAIAERETSMAMQDKIIQETNDARNQLESYVLEMRNKLDGELRDFIRQADKEKFLTALTATEDWLYNDGADAQKSDYKKKLTELKTFGDQVEYRRFENENRLENVNALKRTITNSQNWAQTTDEKFAHISPEERKKVIDEIVLVDAWLNTELAKQEKVPIADNPLITIEFIKQKKHGLDNFVTPIMNKPKPEPPKPEPKKEEAKKEEPKGTGGASASGASGTGSGGSGGGAQQQQQQQPPSNDKDKKTEEKPKSDDKKDKEKMETQ